MTTASIKGTNANGIRAAFNTPEFKLYFIGQLISVSGTWMQSVAQGWLVFHLTQSELWLGLVACAAGLPPLFLSPFAGVVVDRMPRRKLLIATNVSAMVLAFILALLVAMNTVQVWHIVVLAALLGITNTLDAPARQTFVSDLLPRSALPSGIRLNSMMMSMGRIFGPSIAGVVLAQFGAAWCFLINSVSFVFVIGTLLTIHPTGERKMIGAGSPITQLIEGWRFSRLHPVIAPLLLLSSLCSIFTVNLMTLLPAYASVVLKSPEAALAAMSASQGFGAVVAGGLAGWLHMRFGRGRIVVIFALFTPLLIALLPAINDTLLATLITGVVGFSQILMFVTINTLLQTESPEAFRGRVISLYTLTWLGLTPFGALALSLIGELTDVNTALLWCAAAGLISSLAVIVRAAQMRRVA
jgi:MFS family permease